MECLVINNKKSSNVSKSHSVDMNSLFKNLDDDYTFAISENNLLDSSSKHSKYLSSKKSIICAEAEMFITKKMFFGIVSEINEENVNCRLIDLDTKIEELIEFEIDEFSMDDRELIVLGGTFQFFIGYFKHPMGQRVRGSLIKMDRYVSLESNKEQTGLILRELEFAKRKYLEYRASQAG